MKTTCEWYRTVRGISYLVIALAVALSAGCAGTPRFTRSLDRGADNARVLPAGSFHQTGMASYYAHKFHGRKTASGERFDMHDLTAAHPTLPFNTRVRVTNLSTKQSVVVRVNDRGPFKKGRIIDVSLAAAKKIGLLGSGTAKVSIEVVR